MRGIGGGGGGGGGGVTRERRLTPAMSAAAKKMMNGRDDDVTCDRAGGTCYNGAAFGVCVIRRYSDDDIFDVLFEISLGHPRNL